MRRERVEIRLNQQELSAIKQTAVSLGLSVSEYLRRCGCKRKVHSRIDQQSIDDLLGVNADLARLGNLMKFAMTEFSDETDDRVAQKLIQDAHETMGQIRDQRVMLKQKIIALKS